MNMIWRLMRVEYYQTITFICMGIALIILWIVCIILFKSLRDLKKRDEMMTIADKPLKELFDGRELHLFGTLLDDLMSKDEKSFNKYSPLYEDIQDMVNSLISDGGNDYGIREERRLK